MSLKHVVAATLGLGLAAFGCRHAEVLQVDSAAEATEVAIPDLPSGLRSIGVQLGFRPAATLQAAIDALGPEGGILRLPAGTFELEDQVHLRSNVHLVGVPGQTVLVGKGSRTLLDAPDCTDVSIRDLVLDADENAQLQRALVATRTVRLGIYRCEIRNTGKDAFGIELQKDVTEARIIGNYLHDIGDPGDKWGTAITLGWGSSEAIVTDNRIERCSRAGLNAHNDCQNLSIARNDIRRIDGEGLAIELWSGCSGTVEHNRVASWISFDGSRGLIQDNEVDGAWNAATPRYGIEVVAGDGVQVLRNRIASVRLGVSLDKSKRCLVEGNTIAGTETGLQGYGAKEPCRDNTVRFNTFQDGSGRAMMLNQDCDGWRIEGNLIERYFKSGIYLYATDRVTLVGNTLRRTCQGGTKGEAAIYWNSDRRTQLLLTGNTLSENPLDYGGDFRPHPAPGARPGWPL